MQLIYIITHTAPISTEQQQQQQCDVDHHFRGLQNAIEENKSFERQRTCRPYFKKQRQHIVMMIVIMIMMIVVNDLCEGSIGKLCGKQSDPFVRFEFDFEFVFSFVAVRILPLSLCGFA